MDLTQFDTSQVELNDNNFEVIPIDKKYRAQIIDSIERETRAGGFYLEFTVELQEGKHAGRRVWDRLNLGYVCDDAEKQQKVRNIALRQLERYKRAVGVTNAKDSFELHCRDFIVKLGIEEYNGEKKNNVKFVEPMKKGSEKKQEEASSVPAWRRPSN